jgi:peptidoglycan/LPS O-acetylase OafA/YrhL
MELRFRQPKATANYIPTLDGLRAVAILLVIFSHTIELRDYPTLVTLGHVGVQIFFALSGYLITSRLVQEFKATGQISLRNFYIRRVFRILPPAFFYLATVSVLASLGIVVCSWQAIRSAIFLYTNYVDLGDAGWRAGHFWSLSVEEHFYLFWPALLIVFGVRKGWRTAAALAIAVSAWRIFDDHYHILARLFHNPFLVWNDNHTDAIADVLLWGCCLAYLVRPPLRELWGPLRSTVVAVAAAGSMVAIIFWHVEHMKIPMNLLPTVLLGAIIATPNAPVGKFLELAVVRFIGRLSYSLYIWQQLFLGGPGPRLRLPFALLAICGCSLFSYYLIEQPAIRFGRRFCRKPGETGSNGSRNDYRRAIGGN